jgi:hypothetical protein
VPPVERGTYQVRYVYTLPSSAAAAFQAWMYGGFTPAAGVFPKLTSMGMLGVLMPAVLVIATVLATMSWGDCLAKRRGTLIRSSCWPHASQCEVS